VLLPNREELALVLEQSINGLPDELKAQVKQIDTERVVNAALGLTAEEAYSAFARSLVEKKTLGPGADHAGEEADRRQVRRGRVDGAAPGRHEQVSRELEVG